MTNYSQLLAIMNDLKGVNKIVNYKGVFNDGLNNSISNKADLVSANGSKADFDALMNYFDGENNTLFLSADLMRVSDTSGGFWPKPMPYMVMTESRLNFRSITIPSAYLGRAAARSNTC